MSFLRIKSSTEESFDSPYLGITIIEGANLIPINKNGYSDPYVIIKSGSNKIKSKTLTKTLNPQWNQELRINVHPFEIKDDGHLEIECWNYNRLKSDEFMGKCKIELSKFTKDAHPIKFIQKLEGVEKGEIIFEMMSFNFDMIKEETKKIRNEQKEIILEKLLQSSNHAPKSNEIILKMAKILSDKELLKENYLTTTWLDALKKQEEVENSVIELTKEENKEKYEKDIEKNEQNQFFDDIKIEKEQEKYQEKRRKSSSAFQKHHLKKDLKIKIVFVDQIKDDKVQKGIRELLSPVISNIGSNVSEFGFFHTALIIGSWMIEWNDSSLCIPRKCLSKAAFLSADIGEISTIESLETIRDKIANVIVYWNINYHYSTFSKGKNSGNCQDFVETILSELDLKLDFEGSLFQFLKQIKKNGRSKLIFPVSQEIKYDFQILEDEIEFLTHKELDHFVNKLENKDHNFSRRYKNDYLLLKSFDRAFWMKHFKIESEIDKFEKELKQLKKYQKSQNEEILKKKITKIQNEIKKRKEALKVTRPIEYSENGSNDFCPFDNPTV
eukprot:gene7112-11275_t